VCSARYIVKRQQKTNIHHEFASQTQLRYQYPQRHSEVDGGAAKGDEAAEGVARAANGVRGAAASTDADYGNGRASQTNLTGDVAENNTKKAEERRDPGRARSLDGLAALERSDVALGRLGRRRGDRKKREEGESSDLVELHRLREIYLSW